MSLFPRHVSRDEVAIDDGVTSLRFGELEGRVAAIAEFIRRDLGLSAGATVALHLRNRAAFAEVILGCLAAGVWVTPINWHLTESEIAYVLSDSGAHRVFVDAATRASLPPGAPEAIDVDELLARLSTDPPPLDMGAPPGGTMIYTSGTSGKPKGVRRARAETLGEALEAMRSGGRRFGLDGEGPHLVTGPMYHAAPLLFAVYDLLNGAPMIVMRRWDEREALRLMRERGVRHAHFVPTMFSRLARLPAEEREAFDPSALRLVLHGAAPIAPKLKRAMIRWWGPVLVEYWGATEGGIYTLVESREWLEREGTVGRPVETFEVFAVDDAGERLPAGRVGTLYCRHRTLKRPFEYHGDRDKTDRAYLAPGVFTAFDLGHVDAEGYVHLSARRSDLILRGGVNIYPAEVERALSSHSAVADAIVYGIPDEEWGERVGAAVELSAGACPGGALAEEIVGVASGALARFKLPTELAFVSKIPRNEAGKLRRGELDRALASAETSRHGIDRLR